MYYDFYGNPLSKVYDFLGKVLSDSRYKTFSVLADSYGAFEGHTDPLTNAHYYPSADVTDYTQMWWFLFGQSYGCTLDKCNAFSGSRVSNDANFGGGIENNFIGRSSNLGNPDLIIVLGGTNDFWNAIEVGTDKFSGWSDSDLTKYRPAVSYLINKLKTEHPDADIIWLWNKKMTGYGPPNGAQIYPNYERATYEICEHYGIPCIDLTMEVVGNHPSAVGMKQIRNTIMEHLGEEPRIVRNVTIGLTMPCNLTWNPDSNKFSIGTVDAHQLYVIEMTVDSVGSSDAYIYISASANQSAVFASFEEYKGKTGKFVKLIETSNFNVGSDVTLKFSVTGSSRNATISNLSIKQVTYDIVR